MPPSNLSATSHVRVDGPAKVTGKAQFSFDVALPNLAHAVAVTSTVACGRIAGFDLPDPRDIPGLLGIFTYRDFQNSIVPVKHLMAGGYVNSSALPLGSPEVLYAGQIVAIVVAVSLEVAQHSANRIIVRYEAGQQATPLAATFEEPGARKRALSAVRTSHKDPVLGNAPEAWKSAPACIDAEYRTPIQHHNPMELFGTTCVWNGSKLTIYEPTRHVDAVQHGVAAQLNLNPADVRVVCPFLGGHFGSKFGLSQYTAPVALAALRLKRPVKFVTSRSQCFTVATHRPETRHQVRIGATDDGRFTCFFHLAETITSRFDDFTMEGTDVTASLYSFPNVETSESIVQVDRNTPGPMRAPPEVPYLFALESAVDELADKLGLDPIELRRKNDTNIDLVTKKPFAPRVLMECFDAGAKAFGWSARDRRPKSMKDGDWLVGFGCSSAVRPAKQGPATMRVTLFADGRASVETAHHEIGNGIYTVLAMEAAARLGLDLDAVNVFLGDTALPPAGISGGSSTTGSLVPCLANGCEALRARLAAMAIAEGTLFRGRSPEDLRLVSRSLVASDGQRCRSPRSLRASAKRSSKRLLNLFPKEPAKRLWHHCERARSRSAERAKRNAGLMELTLWRFASIQYPVRSSSRA